MTPMSEKDLQEWEEFDSRLDEGPFTAATSEIQSSAESEHEQLPGALESPFLSGESGESAWVTESLSSTIDVPHECSCGGRSGETLSEKEGFEASENEALT